MLQGKLELVKGNFDIFELLLTQAKELATVFELNSYLEWINTELTNFKSELQKWHVLLSTNVPLKERLEAVELEIYVKDVQKLLDKNLLSEINLTDSTRK